MPHQLLLAVRSHFCYLAMHFPAQQPSCLFTFCVLYLKADKRIYGRNHSAEDETNFS